MKPLHVGLMVIGAAFAGGLAVKMTQAPPVPVTVAAPLPETAPPVAKPSPIPAAPASKPEVVAIAPPPVFEEPPPKAAIRKNESRFKPRPATPPVLTARAAPMQWTPGRYTGPVAQAAPPQTSSPPQTSPPLPTPEPRKVTLPAGMIVVVRLSQTPDRDTFDASLSEPIVADGLAIAERGARVTGHVIHGAAPLAITLTAVETSDGQRVPLSTDSTPATFPREASVPFRLSSEITVTERQLPERH